MEHSDEEACKQANLKGCLEWNFKLIQFAGFWAPRSTKKATVLQYTLYSILMLGCTQIAYMLAEIAYLVFVFGQLEEMINLLFLLLTHASYLLKIISINAHRQKIFGLLDSIDEDIFKPRNVRQLRNALKEVRVLNAIGKSLVGMVILTVVLWSIFPLLENDENNKKVLPLRAWFPFDVTQSPQFELVYVYQILTVVVHGCANATADMIMAGFIAQVNIQLNMLCDSMTHVKEFAEESLRKKNSAVVDAAVDETEKISQELQKEMEDNLIKCVKHHLKIKR